MRFTEGVEWGGAGTGEEMSAATDCSDESAFVAKRRDRVNTCCAGGRKKPRK